MTKLEIKLYDVILNALEKLTKGKVTRPEYLELLGELRNTVRLVDNIKAGCPEGRHNCTCKCKGEVK